MKITRTAYRRVVEEYELTIDQTVVDYMNDDFTRLSKRYDVGFCNLTLKEVEDLVRKSGRGYETRDNEKLAFTEMTLGDYVREWVSDMIWEADYTEVDGYTNDWEDEIVYD